MSDNDSCLVELGTIAIIGAGMMLVIILLALVFGGL
jgi:hypothetical protein